MLKAILVNDGGASCITWRSPPPCLLAWRVLIPFARGARHIGLHDLAALYRRLDRMCRRVGLPQPPELYLLRWQHLNAFTVGYRDDQAIAMTYGMLRALTMR